MKKLVPVLALFITYSLLAIEVTAQTKFPPIDKSPMDMSYYPNGYPVLKIQDKATDPLVARVIYSRPQKNGRTIFGDLLEYGKVWRLGANEATEIEFFQNVKINNTKVKKGRYTLYCIPYADKWTIIVNKENDTWGSFKYDMKKDLLRIDVPVQKSTEINEAFVMAFEKAVTGASLVIAWDDVKVSLPIVF
ncbi:DUF2911 domain-containing protein [Ferruginibacter sp. SUN106]|uniref:DUF2911 domain-containing protein n=1 Tax=Ferruginibacter sp. SUN106 TaxID=2978348 RepID=UPI003D36F100